MGKRLKNFWGKLWPTILGPVGGWILAFLGVAGLLVWAWLKQWFTSQFAPLTIPIIFLLILIIFSSLNQIRKYGSLPFTVGS